MPVSRYDRHCMDTISSSNAVVTQSMTLGAGALVTVVNAEAGPIELVLPPVDVAAGNIYVIRLLATVPQNSVTVYDSAADPAVFTATVSDPTLPLSVFSDGVTWHVMFGVAPA